MTVWAVIFTALTVYAINGNRNRAMEGQEARDALCVLRVDLERRLDSGREFLRANPDGIPGIPASTLRTSIRNQEATLESLSELDCIPPPSKEE